MGACNVRVRAKALTIESVKALIDMNLQNNWNQLLTKEMRKRSIALKIKLNRIRASKANQRQNALIVDRITRMKVTARLKVPSVTIVISQIISQNTVGPPKSPPPANTLKEGNNPLDHKQTQTQTPRNIRVTTNTKTTHISSTRKLTIRSS